MPVVAALAIPVSSILAAATPQAALPPYTQAYQPQSVDERGLWMRADEDERQLRESRFIVQDAALRDYVGSVLCRAVGNDRCRSVRIYVVRVASFNANMTPNGTMQVWSGLLLRVRSEAELAAILGHEFAHFELRHGLSRFRQQRLMSDIATWAGFAGQQGISIRQGAMGAVFSFTRDQEKQADILSLQYALKSDYSAQAAAHVWQRLMDEADATALGRKQKSHRYDRVAFFDTHPPELERATYLSNLAKDSPVKTEGDADYRRAMAKWLPEFLQDQIKLNDFGGTEYLLSQLAGENWSAPLLFARGELYRGRGHPRDLVAAAEFYRAALAQDAELAEAYRGMGLALLRSGQKVEGQGALQHYLEMRPMASDASVLKMLVSQ